MLSMVIMIGFFTVGVLVFIAIKLHIRATKGFCKSTANIKGKTVIITGANTGIGYETALDLARRNGRIILACRDPVKGEKAAARIREAVVGADVIVKTLDLCSFRSIRTFARDILRDEHRLNVLINNAGVTALPFTRTEDGLEETFAANHFGPFLLTNLLLDLMKKSAPARIVNLSSICHAWGAKIEFDNLHSERVYNYSRVYFDAKLAVILFTRELAKRLEGTGVTANSLHPGTSQTHLLRNLALPIRLAFKLAGYFFFKSCWEGAQTTIHCAICEEVNGITGKYFSDCRLSSESATARDDSLAKRLWEASERVTKLNERSGNDD